MITPKRFSEALGLWTGAVVAPMFAVGSALRQARVFHPRGISFRAEAKPAEDIKEMYTEVAEGLSQGEALARLSPGVWRGDKGLLPDVLGFSIRFGADPAENWAPGERTQDLLLVTTKRLLTLPLAMLSTNQRDFLGNSYYGGAPFQINGKPNLRLRLVPLTQTEPVAGDRFAKLRKAVADGDVSFRLDIVSDRDPSLSSPLIEIGLTEEVQINEEELEFWPFNTGQDIVPMGFVQFTRPVPYLLSQYARDI